MGHAVRIAALAVSLGLLPLLGYGCVAPEQRLEPGVEELELYGPPHPDQPLPYGWLGTWRGELYVAGSTGSDARVPMTLSVARTEDPARWRFHLEFGVGEESDRRPYTLRRDPEFEDTLVLDEEGAELRLRHLGRQLILHATVGSSWIFVRYEWDAGRILYEAFGGPTEIPPEWSAGQPVASFPTRSFQRAVLHRRPPGERP